MAIGIQMPTGLVQRSTVSYLDRTSFRWMNVVASDIESDIDHIGSHLPVFALQALHQTRSHLSRSNDIDKPTSTTLKLVKTYYFIKSMPHLD